MRKIKVSFGESAYSIFDDDALDIYEAEDNESAEEIIANCAQYLFDEGMSEIFESAKDIESHYIWKLEDYKTLEIIGLY